MDCCEARPGLSVRRHRHESPGRQGRRRRRPYPRRARADRRGGRGRRLRRDTPRGKVLEEATSRRRPHRSHALGLDIRYVVTSLEAPTAERCLRQAVLHLAARAENLIKLHKSQLKRRQNLVPLAPGQPNAVDPAHRRLLADAHRSRRRPQRTRSVQGRVRHPAPQGPQDRRSPHPRNRSTRSASPSPPPAPTPLSSETSPSPCGPRPLNPRGKSPRTRQTPRPNPQARSKPQTTRRQKKAQRQPAPDWTSRRAKPQSRRQRE